MTTSSRRVRLARTAEAALLPFTAICLAAGAVAHLVGQPAIGDAVWILATIVSAARLAVGIAIDLMAGSTGVDVVALLAMVGSVALGEYLAGAVIAVMYATGQALEQYAHGRAERELRALVSRAPGIAHHYEDGVLVDRPAEALGPGDRLLIKPGEVVPVDGIVVAGPAALDESALTGESRIVVRDLDDRVASGVVNAGAAFDIRAAATADASTYAGIVRLVRIAQTQKSPFVRIADRYAGVFLVVSLGLAGLAWIVSGDPVRALAVLVVATPCPLLLAAPIAIVAGISRSARRGVIVKGGGALEALGRARVLLMDKTGTLTTGRPRLEHVAVRPGDNPDVILGLAASLDQLSPHVLARETIAQHIAQWSGIPFVALRFSNILDADDYARFPSHFDHPMLRKWNLWSYIDLRDAAAACRVALEAKVDGATSFIIVAPDTVMTTPTAELVRMVFPGLELRGEVSEFGSLMSGKRAQEALGFEPQHSWREAVLSHNF